jgi:hypothetical protein
LLGEDEMKNSVTLTVNKKSVALNPFVRKAFGNVVMGLVASLDRIDEKVEQVEVVIKVEDGED